MQSNPSLVRVQALPPSLVWAACGFAFWTAVLLALEPGNVLRAWAVGRSVDVAEETRRIFSASLLGGAVVPIQLDLAKRFPVSGTRLWPNLAVQVVALLALSLSMLFAAHMLAPLILSAANPRLHTPFLRQVGGDIAIVLLALAAAGALLQRRTRISAPAAAAYVSRLAVPTGAGAVMIEAGAVDWFESQGNYVALHVGTRTHLVRMTFTDLQRRLDPAQFVQIHRRLVVNRARLVEMRRLGNGDAEVRLDDATVLRASRTYAERVREAFARR